jgi:hypothetical protein
MVDPDVFSYSDLSAGTVLFLFSSQAPLATTPCAPISPQAGCSFSDKYLQLACSARGGFYRDHNVSGVKFGPSVRSKYMPLGCLFADNCYHHDNCYHMNWVKPLKALALSQTTG